MLHGLLVAAHAVAATLALLAGLVAVRRGRGLDLFSWSVVAMEAFLVLAVAAGWRRDAALHAPFVALVVLGAVMVARARLAVGLRPVRGRRLGGACLGHVGFVLIGLTDAFVVVSVLDAGAPVAVVVAAGVVVAVGGHLALTAARRRPSPASLRRNTPLRRNT